MTAPLDVSQLSLAEKKALLWRAGDLSYLLRPHQVDAYKQWHAYNDSRHDPKCREQWRKQGAKWPELFVFAVARRWGKSTLAFLLLLEQAIRRPGTDYMLCTAYQASIGSIFLKIVREVFTADAPEGYAPVYHRSANGLSEHLEIPATGSTIRLVGLDRNPEKTRGNSLDGCLITEVSFMSPDLVDTYQSAIVPQYRGRPHAFTIMESSFAYTPDHCFHATFAEDAAKRGAYVERTIYESGLSDEEIEEELLKCGGKDSAAAKRELLCEHAIDRERAVAPSFTPANIVPADYALPKYGLGITSFDPGGFGDQAGVCFMLVDPSKREVIVQASAGLRLATTDELADFVRDTEQRLWGTHASTTEPAQQQSLRDILKGPRVAPQRQISMERLSIDALDEGERYEGDPVLDAPEGTTPWWSDEHASLRPNPYVRLSDVAPQQLADMRARHGIVFRTPSKGKGNLSAQIALLNDFLFEGSLKILDVPENQELIKQLRSGRWNAQGTDLERSAAFGHLDVLVSLSIGLRGVRWDIDPRRPQNIYQGAGFFTPPSVKQILQPLRPATDSRSAAGARARDTRHKQYR